MKIALIGASGFLGSSLSYKLVQHGHEVYTIGRDVILNSEEGLGQQLNQCEWIVNCAGATRILTTTDSEANTLLPAKLYMTAAETSAKGFLHVSSVAAINSSNGQGPAIDETYPESPSNKYGLTKLEGDQRLNECRSENLKLCILRPPILYNNNATGVFAMLRRCAMIGLPMPFRSIKAKRSFMFVENFSIAVLSAIKANLSGTYIVVDHEPISIGELYDLMTFSVGKGHRTFSAGHLTEPLLRLLLQNRASSLLDNACYSDLKFRERTGFSPEYSRAEAMEIVMQQT